MVDEPLGDDIIAEILEEERREREAREAAAANEGAARAPEGESITLLTERSPPMRVISRRGVHLFLRTHQRATYLRTSCRAPSDGEEGQVSDDEAGEARGRG